MTKIKTTRKTAIKKRKLASKLTSCKSKTAWPAGAA